MSSATERPKPNSPAATRVSGSNSDGPPSNATSTAYNLIMTPVNFVTFLLSLVLVDLRYALRRKHTHSRSTSRLPPWLHTLLYRPYENDRTKATVAADGRWYYHTKQKKLFKMEADEAFRFRNTMLILVGLLSIGVFAVVWYVTGQLFRRWTPLVPGPH